MGLREEAIHDLHQQVFEERLQEQERDIREKLQVLEGWKACAEGDLRAKAVGYLMDELRLELMDIEATRRFGPSTVQTSMNEPGYWEEKGRELKDEGEGKTWPEDENFGDA